MRPSAGRGTPATSAKVELARLARLERLAEESGGGARSGDQKHTGRVAVEAMNEPRLPTVAVGERVEHLVDVACHSGAALHREPERLVEHDHVRILVQDDRLQRFAIP